MKFWNVYGVEFSSNLCFSVLFFSMFIVARKIPQKSQTTDNNKEDVSVSMNSKTLKSNVPDSARQQQKQIPNINHIRPENISILKADTDMSVFQLMHLTLVGSIKKSSVFIIGLVLIALYGKLHFYCDFNRLR